MDTRPLVSVIITTKNRRDLLPRAIDSVLNQGYENIELVVVDDHSSDGTGEIINSYKKTGRLKYILMREKAGLAAARNAGIAACGGQYCAFLDDDDVWKQTKIEKQIDLLRGAKRECGVVYCGAEILSPGGNRLYAVNPETRGDIKSGVIKHGLSTISSSYLYKMDALETIGGFDENLVSSIDHDMWMSLGEYGYAADYVDEPLVSTVMDNRPSMVNDAEARVRGVNQFLLKWRATLENWLGKPDAERFVEQYYLRIAKPLLFRLAKARQFGDAFRMVCVNLDRTEFGSSFRLGMLLLLVKALAWSIIPEYLLRHYLRSTHK